MLVVFLMKRFLGVMAVALSGVWSYAQVPEIYRVIPRTAKAGEVVRIIGQDFDPLAGNNVVHFGGVRAQVRESWVAELEVEVPPAAQEGAITVATSGRMAVSPTPFQPLFAPFGESSAAYRRAAILPRSNYVGGATADLNGDGGAELLLLNTDTRVDVYEYVPGSALISPSSFEQRAQLAGTTNNTNMIAVDFDADGRMDILTLSPTGLELFRNVHEGGLLSAASFAPRLRANRSIPALGMELVDVDKDGRLDVIAREAMSVSFHVNTYDPTTTNQWLGPRIPIAAPFNASIRHMVTGDLNHDGHVDVVIADGESVRIYSHNSRRDETDRFTLLTIPMIGVSFVHLLDVEGNGSLDILTHNGNWGRYEVLRNRNQGGHLEAGDFERVTLAQQELLQRPPKILDINGDGFQDWISRISGSGAGVHYENQSRFVGNVIFPGSFLSVTNIITNSPVVITADLNRDGTQDVITLHFGVTVFQNMSAQPVQAAGIQTIETPPTISVLVIGRPNATVTLESSTDLKGWGIVGSGRVGASGTWEYRSTPVYRTQFYRVQPAAGP